MLSILKKEKHTKTRQFVSMLSAQRIVGSSFLLHLQDWSIFHAGDLNNWHWSEESTEEEIRKANGDFLAEVKYLKEKAPNIDLILFPVDRRMGKDYMKGAKQFIEQNKNYYICAHALQ